MAHDSDTERKRYFSDTFVISAVPKNELYGFTQSSQKHQVVFEEHHFSENCCHVTVWTYVIAVIEILALVTSLLATIIEYATADIDYALENFIVVLVATCIGGAVIGLLIMGIRTERYNFLLPHMVCQILSMLGLAVAIIIYGVEAGIVRGHLEHDEEHKDSKHTKADEKNYGYVVAVIVLCAVGLVIEGGFYAQVSKCYRYLKNKKIRRMHLVRRRSSV